MLLLSGCRVGDSSSVDMYIFIRLWCGCHTATATHFRGKPQKKCAVDGCGMLYHDAMLPLALKRDKEEIAAAASKGVPFLLWNRPPHPPPLQDPSTPPALSLSLSPSIPAQTTTIMISRTLAAVATPSETAVQAVDPLTYIQIKRQTDQKKIFDMCVWPRRHS